MLKVYLPKFYQLLEEHLGITLDESKQYLIESRLLPIIESSDFDSVLSLIKYLTQNDIGALHWKVFELLITNETSFFRDKHVFDGIKDVLIPKIIKDNQASKTIRIWNAAVSSGQEAYSVAMLISEFFPELRDWKITIHGTDVSRAMLDKAKAGIYTAHEVNRGIDKFFKDKYFSLDSGGNYLINQPIKEMTTFTLLNLISEWSMPEKYDLVMLRNVLIYFNHKTQVSVLDKVTNYIDSNHGALVVGASEILPNTNSLVRSNLGGTFYYRPI
ncbi:protein-glutamate O-methyltransferase CheR [Polynucleobacter sp. MWH-UH2A]|uniref:CheR family methyltransferase n=1 Tax=Polynucleobacter sp. MWH-UH2A TaxID=1855617 RepID=UPI001BFDBDDD|nr:protein-glutamate O-methyltransferase CheR [Polynucleobacter sp. MWH-UH2A]QWD64911.1 protein-glutamate O-methyltransferase CheR [Polynucleobacter sp. MWH-UH2A]